MNLPERLLEEEPDQRGNLVVNPFFAGRNGIPQDEVLAERLQQNVVRVALFELGERRWDAQLLADLLVICLQIQQQ